MHLEELATRLTALGYRRLPAGEGNYFLFIREEPLLRRVLIIGNGEEHQDNWRSFIGEHVLPHRNDNFSVGILLLGGRNAATYLTELPWVEVVWTETGGALKTIKPHPRWGVEERLFSLIFRPPRVAPEEIELYPPGKITYYLMFINLLFFVATLFLGRNGQEEALIRMGAKYNPLIWLGEPWRLLTPLFLHAGLIHFLLNSFALFQLGRVVERLFGGGRFIFLYFFSGLLGSCAGTVFRPETISVGASGAIFGLLGGLIYFSLRKPHTARRFFGSSLWTVLGINLVLGFIIPGIDYLGHLGGFLGGLSGGAAVGLGKKDILPSRWLWTALFTCFTLFMLVFSLIPPEINWYGPLEEGRLALNRGDLETAVVKLEESYELKSDYPLTKEYLLRAYFLRGNQRYQEQNLAGAEADYLKGIALEDDRPGFHYNLGVVYLRRGRLAEAKKEFQRVLELDPANQEAREILEHLETLL